jgi:hypothetical protein
LRRGAIKPQPRDRRRVGWRHRRGPHTEYIAATIPHAGLLILPNASHFAFLPLKGEFNGSLWTLPIEARMYIYLAEASRSPN